MFDIQAVEKLQLYKYENRRAYKTIADMSSPDGLQVEWGLLERMRDMGFDLDVNRDNKSVYDPQSCFDNLAKYATDRKFKVNEKSLEQAIRLTTKVFVGRYGETVVPLIDDEDIKDAVKKDKSSGAPEFAHKGDVLDKEIRRMYRILAGEKKPDPCVAYHRVQHGDKGPKNRLVWGYPASMTMAESIFARPLINHFLSVMSPMSFGKHRFKLSAKMTPILNTYYKYSLDYSAFDASVSERLIKVAFSILRKLIKFQSKEEELWWSIIQKYFIHTTIIMPDGYVYQKHRGVPSGSYFTQMIDSVVNYLSIQYANICYDGIAIEEDKLLVLGDDSLFASPREISLLYFSNVLGGIGLTMNPSKVHKSFGSTPVHYLGHIWIRGLVDRDLREIARRIPFKERFSKEEDPRQRIINCIYPYVGDAIGAHKIIRKFSYGGGAPDKCYYKIRYINVKDSLGWQENLYSTGIEVPSRNSTQMKNFCYYGILK